MTEEEVQTYLAQVSGWHYDGKKIRKEFRFSTFREAIRFVTQVAEIAESEDHHPAIRISYTRVRLTLITHVIKGLSENDFILVAKIDQLQSQEA